MENTKLVWLQSGTKNIVGTILWGLSGILWLVLGIRWFALASEVGQLEILVLPYLANFILYAILTVGMIRSVNLCSALAKAWGILSIVMLIVGIVEIVVLLLVVDKMIDAINISGMFDSLSDSGGFTSWLVMLLLAEIFTIASAFTITVTNEKKSRLATLILAIFMGGIGGHLIYAQRTKAAVVRIVLNVTVFLSMVAGILWLIDFIKILKGTFKDSNGESIQEWV